MQLEQLFQDISVTAHSSAAEGTRKMAFRCLKTGTEFLQLGDLEQEQPERDTAPRAGKKTGKGLTLVHGVSLFPGWIYLIHSQAHASC